MEFRIKPKWESDTLVLNYIVKQGNQVIEIDNTKFSNYRSVGLEDKCSKYDDDNWTCYKANRSPQLEIYETIESVNGEITWYYFTELRKLQRVKPSLKKRFGL
jgi:hypothetical protein